MSESPDLPWHKNFDTKVRSGPLPIINPSEPAVFFLNFLFNSNSDLNHKGNQIVASQCRFLHVGIKDGSNSIFFSKSGFGSLTAIDSMEKFHLDLELYGISVFCTSPFEYWPFDDCAFDVVFDENSFQLSVEPKIRHLYLDQLTRTLMPGGIFAIVSDIEEKNVLSEVKGFRLLLKKTFDSQCLFIFSYS
ncbi:class I SAM-dependent methyltransferase [Candidatus Micrarchaeota archaeon]|nr:class I SAM-dependent methyltransferase [Candidatus Micrarchaeota archaeon]